MNKPLAPYTGVVRASTRFGWRVYCYGVWAHFRLLSHAVDCATDLLDQRQRADTRHQPKVAYLGEL
jgi:hypothetical protein